MRAVEGMKWRHNKSGGWDRGEGGEEEEEGGKRLASDLFFLAQSLLVKKKLLWHRSYCCY